MDNLEQLILALENELREATLQNDAEKTNELLAENWININANGTVITKAQTMAIISKFQFVSIVNEEVRVRVYPGVAVVTGQSTRQLQDNNDQVSTSRVLFTRVYAQPNGRWQVITSQATPLSD